MMQVRTGTALKGALRWHSRQAHCFDADPCLRCAGVDDAQGEALAYCCMHITDISMPSGRHSRDTDKHI